MIARRFVWSDPDVVALTRKFVPAADEVWRLQNRDDPECRFFQGFSEEGHYGGRAGVTNTRQGIYACTPGGAFLASLNSNRPEHVARMLREALARWESMSEQERYGSAATVEAPVEARGDRRRPEDRYPEDGLVLRVHTRDVRPADAQSDESVGGDAPEDWRTRAWNLDFAWFRADEVRALFAETAAAERDASHPVPTALAARIARCHLVDNVRGQTAALDARDVESVELRTLLERRAGDLARIRIEGRSRTVRRGKWRVEGRSDAAARDRERGIDVQLLGWADYDARTNRVTGFEMLAVGTRWGASRYNARSDDQEPAPIGIAFTLADDGPADRVAPAGIWSYGW